MNYEVWVDDRVAGSLEVEKQPGFHHASMTFTYLREWLERPTSFAISPDLPLGEGPRLPAPHRTTFAAFDDAAPDAWGRRLVNAEARRAAAAAGMKPRTLNEIDLLFAVDDATRQGALRFRRNGEFLAAPTGSATIHDLPKLVRAAGHFTDSGEIDEDVRYLIGVGSSPGGARPKAWVRDAEGTMHLAKFPQTSDLRDVGAWELTALKLQFQAGIRVQPSSTIPLAEGRSVLLTRRFDREGGHRVPYTSFRTAFGIAPNASVDYATLALRVGAMSADPAADGAELFSRAAFGALVNNIDDHMRNHGLLWTGNGWRLSPSFDVNPERHGEPTTPLTAEDDVADRDVRLLVENAGDFRLTPAQAIQRLTEIEHATSCWRTLAAESGVAPDAVDSMATAFEGPNRERVRALRPIAPTVVDVAPGAASRQQPPGAVWIKPHTRRGTSVGGYWRKR